MSSAYAKITVSASSTNKTSSFYDVFKLTLEKKQESQIINVTNAKFCTDY